MSRSLFQANISWAVCFYRYGEGIAQWTKDELKQIYRESGKLIALLSGMHSRSVVDRIYVERKKG